MYTGFFGLSEQPFSISPNPQYLFMSNRHKEALAHLNFGLGDSGGFVLLTGEVGTGKTTVSRCMLEQLPAETEVAFILNPTLSEIELLGTICDEFKIRFKRSDATLKMLTDKIKARLLKNHAAGKSTLLIIDEAQHLKTEVLEQLRLLTNLETNTKKLLQIILIGQPELQQLLKRQELRQLAQRITARYHLLPLTEQEIAFYITHRLRVAGCERPVFDPKAIKLIHETTKGIPRLVNLLCDRALMGAYATQSPFVNKKIVALAAKELLVFDQVPKVQNPWQWLPIPIAIILLLTIALIYSNWPASEPLATTTPAPATTAPTITEQPAQQDQPTGSLVTNAPPATAVEQPRVDTTSESEQTVPSTDNRPPSTDGKVN